MFNKRALLLFFIIFTSNLWSQNQDSISTKDIIGLCYKNIPTNLYAKGIIEFQSTTENFIIQVSQDDSNKNITILPKIGDKNITSTTIPTNILNMNWEELDYQMLRSENYLNLPTNRIIGTTDNDVEYKKIIYTTSTSTNIILKIDFFKDSTQKNPMYSYSALDIAYINENYIITKWEITNNINKDKYLFKLNIEEIKF